MAIELTSATVKDYGINAGGGCGWYCIIQGFWHGAGRL